MRRVALVAFVAVLLGVASFAQAPVARHADRLSVALPASFRASTAAPAQAPDGVRLDVRVFQDMASRRLVVVSATSGLSWWQRVAYKRGLNFAGSSNWTYRRVPPSRLPLSDSFAGLAGVAYMATEDTDGTVGVLVRGCDDDTCYQVAVEGPSESSGVRGAEIAGLLSGVTVAR